MAKQKPLPGTTAPSGISFHIVGPSTGLPTLEDLIAMATALTGRPPTEAEIAEARAILDEPPEPKA